MAVTYRPVTARLIPAHAGKTSRKNSVRRASRAHPRSRGENRPANASASRRSGSSPLTRGKLHRSSTRPRVAGLIPAHAGKTHCATPYVRVRLAHPRSRGENSLNERRNSRPLGSSPLTRGKLDDADRAHRLRRLIPAHAGKTFERYASKGSERAHPRSRGENLKVDLFQAFPPGSSPLTRGKRLTGAGGATGAGLIPAHAGKTQTDPPG